MCNWIEVFSSDGLDDERNWAIMPFASCIFYIFGDRISHVREMRLHLFKEDRKDINK